MNATTLESIANELAAEIIGRRVGRVFQLSKYELSLDLRLPRSRYLYLGFGPADPAIYLITRRLKDLERGSGNPSPFALSLKKRISGAEIVSVAVRDGERVIDIGLNAHDEIGGAEAYSLIVQLTGRSANAFLTLRGSILDRARSTLGPGQQIGDNYSPPERAALSRERRTDADAVAASAVDGPSAALDAYYTERSAEKAFSAAANAASARITAETRKREKLVANLKSDLAQHGNAEEWKRFGDLLLSNVATGRREGTQIFVIDHFSESLPEIAIEANENDSITAAAEKYFRRYAKARNASAEIAKRIEKLDKEISVLQQKRSELEAAIETRDVAFLESLSGKKEPAALNTKKPSAETSGAARKFISSDGLEILVGKRAKDNDVLTFTIARSLDTWMHAADYPGSHVVIRNPNRIEIPHRTLIEAAQLAAFYSQGKAQVKAAVHYTQKKFVNKPKGAAPGLVSLASFKTLLVVPGVPDGVDRS